MIYWAPFLHFYQPPTQDSAILKRITNECYRPLVKLFLEHPYAKVTINMCGVLTEMLDNQGGRDIIDGIRKIAENGRLEFVESAKFHAILPLIPEKEVRRQIELNHKTNEFLFGEAYKARGLFPPEMCYSRETAKIIADMKYDWILISGIACTDKWPQDYISSIPFGRSSLRIFHRDDILSNKISFHNLDSVAFVKELGWLAKGEEDAYIITAMDAETFGHHIQKWDELFLAKAYETIELIKDSRDRSDLSAYDDSAKNIIRELKEIPPVEIVTLSELIEKFPTKKTKEPRPSSWSTIKDDIVKKNYYPLWEDTDNPVHKLQWKHIHISLELMEEAIKLTDNKESDYFASRARDFMDKALHSCQFWWAAKKRGMWSIDMINRGLILQEETVLNAYKALNISSKTSKTKTELHRKVATARGIADKIRNLIISE